VLYSISGTAQYPNDYDFAGLAVPGQVVFNAGQSSVTVVLQSKVDTAAEKPEKAKFKLDKGSGYKPAKWNKATITIRDASS